MMARLSAMVRRPSQAMALSWSESPVTELRRSCGVGAGGHADSQLAGPGQEVQPSRKR